MQHSQAPIIDANPSPWWYWSVAIYLGLMVTFGVIGAIVMALIPFEFIASEFDWAEDPGEYPENGTQQEQQEWNEQKELWDLQQVTYNLMIDLEEEKPVQLALSSVLALAGIIAIIQLAQQKFNGFALAFVWLVLTLLSKIFMTIRYNEMMNDINALFPDETGQQMGYQTLYSLGGEVMCNTILIALLITCAANSRPKTIEESGFHLHHQQSTVIDIPPKD
jgi:hypothetical protein